ncbi:multiple epidermal growth factor-like domains protein 10 [Branchiostoma lanceolatum]|uniref:multiple epidermal growth factor-like domains protein 10 n=1 Tax=Branchiostoma lanceolatum TaxID=7740 RepID=UPI0034528290
MRLIATGVFECYRAEEERSAAEQAIMRLIVRITCRTLNIDRVGTQATGVFECYRAEEERSAAEQAIMRLIVRSCPAGKWGGGCDRDCPECENGGVCNPSDGRCMCAPGFMGDTCDEACGSNGFGLNCEYKCSDETDSRETCAGRLFCIQDPYACSCYIGFKPPECRDPCDDKTFGVNCLKDCNCKEQCDVVTGACDDGCEAGWEGSDCQTECAEGKFGEDCTETCHCLDDVACDRFTGQCPNDTCAGGWVGEICQDRPCSEDPCQNEGTCLDTPEEGPDYYTCTCTEGWSGTNCDEGKESLNYKDYLKNNKKARTTTPVPAPRGGAARTATRWVFKEKQEGPGYFTSTCTEGVERHELRRG